MREVLFVREARDLELATSHLVQSSSASRFTAGASRFFILSQSGGRPVGGRSDLRANLLGVATAKVPTRGWTELKKVAFGKTIIGVMPGLRWYHETCTQ